jgi:hypothetical protein
MWGIPALTDPIAAQAVRVTRPDRAGSLPVPAAGLAHAMAGDRAELARIREWAGRVAAAGPAALLVARPVPDGSQPHYPSAVAAYREMGALVNAL